ncbi:MAG: BatA and WFA domain-containing protein [Vicinamibacterales bacterium]|nr:BatA and WFA domain-containing protein [Vicinamibacterales bacterium]
MSFLTPLFFAALAALGVPVLIHMIQRQRTEVIEFPSLMFVRKIPFHSLRRQRIRHWLLLLLRCAALALLIAAFARPFFQSAALVAATGGSREVVVLVDRSYSMGYGNRWDRARDAARGVVRDLAPDDQATVIFFDSGAQSGARSTTDRASLLAAINDAELSAGTTRYGPALQLAQGILEDSDEPLLEAILITDFQRVGVDSAANTLLPPGTVLTPVSVADEDQTPNISVAGASVQRDFFSGRERAAVTARLANRGNATVENLQVSLELNGQEFESLPVEVEANSSATLTFAPVPLEDTAMPISVRAEADALPHDDVFHFTVAPGDVVPVLIVGSPGAADANLYLRAALATSTSPSFTVTTRSVDQVTTDDVAAASVVVLNDVGLPGGQIGAAITRFVEDGGGLWVALGERVRWPGDNLELLPGTMDPPADRDGRGGALGFIEYSHPVFDVFDAPRSGDLTAPRFFRYRPFDVGPETAVLARFDNGETAMAEQAFGAGRVLVWTSTLDDFWNDFVRQGTFLPFVHKVVEYLAEYSSPTPYLTAGQVLDLAQYPGAADLDLIGGNLVVRDPSEDRATVGSDGRAGFIELVEQGFYEIRDTDAADSTPVTVAVNVDLAESNLERVDPQELVAAATGRAAGDRSVTAERELEPDDLERRQTLWWYLLIGALGFLASETVVSNRLSRTELDADE